MEQRSFARYLNVRQAYGASFAPDGNTIAFLTDITGLPQVWRIDAPGAWPEQLTFGADSVRGIAYAPVGDRLLFSRDHDGDERTQLYVLTEQGTTERALTAQPGVIHTFGDWSHDGRRLAYASNARDAAHFDVYVRDADGAGEATPVYVREGSNHVVNWSPADRELL